MAFTQKRFRNLLPLRPGDSPGYTETDKQTMTLNDYIREIVARLTTLEGTVATLVATSVMLTISGAAAPVAGTGFDLGATFGDFSMQVDGTGTGISVSFQGSLDGVTYADIGSAATANGLYFFNSSPVRFVRAELTAITGGAVTVRLAAA